VKKRSRCSSLFSKCGQSRKTVGASTGPVEVSITSLGEGQGLRGKEKDVPQFQWLRFREEREWNLRGDRERLVDERGKREMRAGEPSVICVHHVPFDQRWPAGVERKPGSAGGRKGMGSRRGPWTSRNAWVGLEFKQ